MHIIDTWNPNTYTEDINNFLRENSETILRYRQQDRDIDEHVKALGRWKKQDPNPHKDAYDAVVDNLHQLMASKTIRVFHYTRLVDSEVENILANGFIAPTSETMWRRLSGRLQHIIQEGHLTRDEADLIAARSPLTDPDQLDIRSGLWLTSGVFHPSDDSVSKLVSHWGGEVSYFGFNGNEEPALVTRIQSIGRGRIFEIAIPLSDPSSEQIFGSCNAAKDIVNVFAQKHGFTTDRLGFDLPHKSDIPAASILAVHSEGDEKYEMFGLSYPCG